MLFLELKGTGFSPYVNYAKIRRALQAAEKLNSLKGTAFRPSVNDCNYVRL